MFLPVEDGGERLEAERGKLGHSIVLHGQFFLDAGRKKIHGLEDLHLDPTEIGDERIDESLLRTVWNQRLAQDVVLPMVLPALERYADQQKLSAGRMRPFDRSHVRVRLVQNFPTAYVGTASGYERCSPGPNRNGVWSRETRGLSYAPFPRPQDQFRNGRGRSFPELATSNVVPYDADAPCLWDRPRQWQEPELERLLSRVDGLFTDAPSMEYLSEFLESCAGPYLSTEHIQRRLLIVLRGGLRAAGLEPDGKWWRREAASSASSDRKAVWISRPSYPSRSSRTCGTSMRPYCWSPREWWTGVTQQSFTG